MLVWWYPTNKVLGFHITIEGVSRSDRRKEEARDCVLVYRGIPLSGVDKLQGGKEGGREGKGRKRRNFRPEKLGNS